MTTQSSDFIFFRIMTMTISTTRRQLHSILVCCLFLPLWLSPAASVAATSSSVSLTKDNFEDVTKGKTVFIKWFAPWCGHCQELAPAWEKLEATFQSEDGQGLIAEVDCATEQTWCIKMGITGFPTLTYGDTSHGGVFLEEYRSTDKSFEAMYLFALGHLTKPACSPGNVAPCDAETAAKIYQYRNMTNQELAAAVQKQEGLMKMAENRFDANARVLQYNYDRHSKEYEIAAAKLKRQLTFYKELAHVQEELSVVHEEL
jgi:thiol-disulfide isomerase/thioredoxin